MRKPTIYEALREKLGREPTNAEIKADVERIKREAVHGVHYSLDEQHAKIRDAIAKFPPVFGLRAYPGERFRLSFSASYFRDDTCEVLHLYTQRDAGERGWLDFAKGSPAELQRELVRLDN